MRIISISVCHRPLYFTLFYNEDTNNTKAYFKNHEPWLYTSLFLVFIGIILFGLGAWSGINALS